MATIMVGSARHDEHGNCYTNGSAGDQLQTSSTNDTVGEVSMQEMYTHSSGWYIMRPKSVTHANAIAERMTAACNNKHIGYDQNNRTGINTYGIDTKTDTECDCSSLMRQVVKEATGTDPGNFTTDTEVNMLSKTGLFEDKVSYTSQSKTPVYNGDILVTKTKGHTVAVVSGNARSSSSSSGSSGKEVVASEKAQSFDSSLAGTYKIKNADYFNIRDGAGSSKKILVTVTSDTSLQCWGYYTKASGEKWYYVECTYKSTKYTGFALSTYLKK